MRLVWFIALAAFIVALVVMVSFLIKLFAFLFAPGFNVIVIDFSLARNLGVIAFASLIVALMLLVLIDYIPRIIREGEEA